ncbi:NVEALA domain-containing protein [uncultured Parabacteroides sp.]|uniref:NVEALA domain-containing protein n=1 Tax=uncultured Parabacteroides sp. TaxID=512312 RepID=UPI002598CF31|nr:NVEALA domain-containing protein [uncultured Parabacteroides sp.]
MKKIICIFFITATVIVINWNSNKSKKDNKLSSLALSNIEALANGEDSGSNTCWHGSNDSGGYAINYIECGSCAIRTATHLYSKGSC